eukprot:IDg7438t1
MNSSDSPSCAADAGSEVVGYIENGSDAGGGTIAGRDAGVRSGYGCIAGGHAII